ncbi:helix-turn-helix domain-containing protein [Cellulomonas sp. KRMCY2]|uniref:helix-turn-helix domain-containing protein n=1 Tax=Cellulomonas sp. KRMCY2 TaxID=1304865 RepID=UPI00045EA480|nr:helix-turn-helix transcriptional regulator [Cellulomonas sp. KRMCY2]
MADAPRFTRDRNTPSRRRAAALVEADEMLHASLIAARHDQGLSQQHVAEVMGVTQPTVAAFERYDNDPRLSTIRRYAHAVGVVITHAVSRDGTPVQCGWAPVSTSFTFSVNPGATARQVQFAAPDTIKSSVALAA